MNFLKSILSDDPEPTNPQNPNNSDSDSESPSKLQNDVATSAWSFGDLIQTIATRSESVIETYRKDLQEFSTGLKNETHIVRQAVKDLPTSLEAGKSALDTVFKSTAEIISKETNFFNSDNEQPDTPESNRKRYSWFETQLNLIGNDEATFVEEPEDLEEFRKWRTGFELDERSDEIEDLIGENGALEDVYIKVVPSVVDDETFWLRYFYRVDKLKVQEKVRANLVKRAIVVDDEEELSWDVDDEEDEDETDKKGKNVVGDEGVSLNDGQKHESDNKEDGFNGDKSDVVEKTSEIVEEVKVEEVGEAKSDEIVKSEEIKSEESNEGVSLDVKEVKTEEVAPVKSAEEVKLEESVEKKNDEKVVEDKVKSDAGETKVEEEEDMGWDEIENIGSDDEKKISGATGSGSPNRAELRKRLSVADDEDEDLSWDIEDDDEPVKA